MDERRVIDLFPLPIARGYRRYRNASEVRERHDAAYYLFEVYLKYTASIAVHLLSVTVDDGYVAYLNGQLAAWFNADVGHGPIPFNGLAPVSLEPILIQKKLDRRLLRSGKNVLALHGLNGTLKSSDLSLIPVLETSAGPDQDRTRKLVESLHLGSEGEGLAARQMYIDGKTQALEGHLAGAAEKFLQPPSSIQAGRSLSWPWRRPWAVGDLDEAERRLRAILGTHLHAHRELWQAWFRLLTVRLKKSAEEVLREFPRSNCSCGDDLRWVLEELTRHGAIRLNCAGEEYQSKNGTVWGRDRFSRGGRASLDGELFTGEIHASDDGPIYQKHRWFAVDETACAYRVPVPTGRYRATLHFAEILHMKPGARFFEVRVEGGEAWRCEPLRAGFATAIKESFTVTVRDGALDIELVPLVSSPVICGIEIEKQ